ncbi:GLPGLI family protein [Aquimarina algiphila]|uniref:GLPGLI family protein n=1 Tax=Aquimarina algiphila TaxID=2047982 RepID=A0A554VFQ7_9FLAO|nr:GLPGLI family protein [Aquimarina algiphila]TSE06075.1 GLPGLI family protein [Aquimarina algiphila]
MKKNVNLFFLILPVILCAQSYEIKYERFFSGIHGNLQEIAEKINNKKDKNEDEHKIEQILTYSNGVSICGSSIEEFEVEDKEKSNEHVIATHQVETVDYYKNQKDNILVQNYINWSPMIYGEDILVKSELFKYEWEITNQKTVISGYPCTMAKTINENGYKVLAWFTDKIGINDGPDTYWGLPGLILQLQINDRVLVIATSVKKLKKDVKIVEPTTKGKIMTPKEFKEFKKEMHKPRTMTTPDGKVITISGFGNN